jgi:hypothetical protein
MPRVHERFAGKRRCLNDRESLWPDEDRPFYDAILRLKEEPYPDSPKFPSKTAAGIKKVNLIPAGWHFGETAISALGHWAVTMTTTAPEDAAM